MACVCYCCRKNGWRLLKERFAWIWVRVWAFSLNLNWAQFVRAIWPNNSDLVGELWRYAMEWIHALNDFYCRKKKKKKNCSKIYHNMTLYIIYFRILIISSNYKSVSKMKPVSIHDDASQLILNSHWLVTISLWYLLISLDWLLIDRR